MKYAEARSSRIDFGGGDQRVEESAVPVVPAEFDDVHEVLELGDVLEVVIGLRVNVDDERCRGGRRRSSSAARSSSSRYPSVPARRIDGWPAGPRGFGDVLLHRPRPG